jgi:hypothetical protein
MPAGYVYCRCRDCFELAIEPADVAGAYCWACEDAGCPAHQGQPGVSQDCQRPDAYGQAEEEPSTP